MEPIEKIVIETIGIDQDIFNRAKFIYSEPRRYYHTFEHTMDVCSQVHLIMQGPKWNDPREAMAAALYHDAIYTPGAEDNEERSAELAVFELASIEGLKPSVIVNHINNTAHHFKHISWLTDDGALFLDCDLAGLANDWETFLVKNQAIDKEFLASGTEEDVKSGRISFLENVLNLPRIYSSKYAYNLYEKAARANITRLLEEMRMKHDGKQYC